MTRTQIKKLNKQFFDAVQYSFCYWENFDYSILSHIMYLLPGGNRKDRKSVNDVIIMLDTETSKTRENERDKHGKIIPVDNMIVCWSLAIRAFDKNIVTLYGRKPSDISKCLFQLHRSMKGDKTNVFVHNLAYDWVFIRKFLFDDFGKPISQLNTKPHYPINISFSNGLCFRDSLIIAQRSLDKWGKDLKAEHAKAIGKWDYNKLRTQSTDLSTDELLYIEHDVLCGVECINILMNTLKKNISSFPFTATGIPREQVRKRGEKNNAHDKFLRIAPSFETQQKLEKIYHGGYTHGNRHFINRTMYNVQAFDFASSYPFVMLSEKYPMTKFVPYEKPMTPERIIEKSSEYAIIFRLSAVGVSLKNDFIPMPSLQYSKCNRIVNPILDNGRVLYADFLEIYLTEIDLDIIYQQYNFKRVICDDIEFSYKQYLPRWFTDYIYEKFKDKTMLKGGDPVQYSLAKSIVNSLYGMTVQKPVKENIVEDYDTGEFNIEAGQDIETLYYKYVNKRRSVLPYQWGVYVTAYAFRNLFRLGECVETDMENNDGGMWLYSDTDSCYGINWDRDKIEQYNKNCISILKERGYEGIAKDGRMYYLGIAETEGDKDIYTEFKYQGAKRYAGRQKADGQLHITVAGVPKKTGALCLNDDLNNFSPNFIFRGSRTGKMTHFFRFKEKIEIDTEGNEIGDSIDLCECDYLLSSVYAVRWEEIETEVLAIEKHD